MEKKTIGDKLKNLVGIKTPTVKEQVRSWQSQLRKEQRGVDRQVRDIERTRKGIEKSIREAAKRGDVQSCKILAKETVHAKRAVSRLYTNKYNLNSISLKLGEQLATVTSVGHLEKSGAVMEAMGAVMNQAEMAKNLGAMSREMMKAGVIEEMVADSMEGIMDDDDIEEETDEELSKVLAEVAGDALKDLPGMEGVKRIVTTTQAEVQEGPTKEEEDAELESLQNRLAAVRN